MAVCQATHISEDRFVVAELAAARQAQPSWAALLAQERCRIVGAAGQVLLRDRARMLESLVALRPAEETLAAELLPLLDAARFVARTGPLLLRPRRPPGRRPAWLFGVRAEVRREPFGVVLILAPGNYPLFLAGVQALQALAAGNAVCIKPAPGFRAPLVLLAAALVEAGVPSAVVRVLGDSRAAGEAAVAAGFDRIVFTGSAATGAHVLAAAASTLTPCTMELSGNDPAFVLPGADIAMTARCLAYGLRLNSGATCISPRRVFVTTPDAERLTASIAAALTGAPGIPLDPFAHDKVAAAVAAGARLIAGSPGAGPVVLAGDAGVLDGATEDVFAPVMSVLAVPTMADALRLAASSDYALGCSVFGPDAEAAAFAGLVRAGSVVVNDLIVPTADPRLPFGGRGRSGFGVTRGAEGLLEMTAVKAVSVRRTRFRPQFLAAGSGSSGLLDALVLALHGRRGARLRGFVELLTGGRRWT